MTNASTRPVALRMIVGAAAVVAALLAFVPAASAARDPISGGTTDLHLKTGFLKKLTNLGVGVAGVSTGQVGGAKISLPVTEGMFDPTTAQGHIASPGGFQLVKGARSVPITGVEVNTVRGCAPRDDRRRPHAVRDAQPDHRRPRRLRRADQGRAADPDPEGGDADLQPARPAGQPADQPRVMSNEFSITVPSTLTILGQGEATFNGDDQNRSPNSAKRASTCRAGSNRSPRRRIRKSTNVRIPDHGRHAGDQLQRRLDRHHGRDRNRQERQNPFADDEDHQHPGRIRPEDGDGRNRNHRRSRPSRARPAGPRSST